jgi:hypothetical protein
MDPPTHSPQSKVYDKAILLILETWLVGITWGKGGDEAQPWFDLVLNSGIVAHLHVKRPQENGSKSLCRVEMDPILWLPKPPPHVEISW